MKWTASDGTVRHIDGLGRTLDGEPEPERRNGLDLRHPGPVTLLGEGALHDALAPRLSTDGEGDGVRVLALDTWDMERILAANQEAIEMGVPLLVCGAFEPGRFHVGPFIVPGETACYRCYRDRRLQNTHDRPGLEGLMQGPRFDLDPDLVEATAHLAAHEGRRMQGGAPCATTGAVLVLESPGLRLLHDPIVRVPRCPACGRQRVHPPTAPGTRLA